MKGKTAAGRLVRQREGHATGPRRLDVRALQANWEHTEVSRRQERHECNNGRRCWPFPALQPCAHGDDNAAWRHSVCLYSVDADRLVDILKPQRAEVLVADLDPTAEMAVGILRNADTARLR